ncbi:MAG: rod shape-determining protein MreC [Aquirufa sp.]|jgi:rod shape-determining protein MreC
MFQLFQFLARQKVILLLLLLELVNVWSVFKYNSYQHTVYFNTTNQWAASVLATTREVKSYHQLRVVNETLAQENAKLRSELFRLKSQQQPESKLPYFVSEAMLNRYQAVAARVIDQSTEMSQNFLTIDKGRVDGIQPGMAVISSTGIVGKVMSCTDNLSLIVSVLHTSNSVSAKLKRSGELGYIKWPGYQSEVADLMDVSKYKKVVKGDTVVTSDYNAVFPPNIPIGIVAKVGVEKDDTFHDIKVMLFTQYATLKYVYVIKNRLASQQASLEASKPKIE